MRTAVVGLGFMGSTHARALLGMDTATLAAVVSADEGKLNGDLSGIHGNLGAPVEKLDFSAVKKYCTALEAFADPEIDAVDLCVPTHLHAPLAIAALRAGKHVLVEKPLALNGEECDAMIAAAATEGRILMAAQVLRFFPEYQALWDLTRKSAARTAVFRRRCAAPAWSQWLKNPAESGGGAFDLLIHDVDMCLHLFGSPRSLSATGYEDLAQGIDSIHIALHYDEIGSVLVTGGWHHPKAFPFSMEYTVSFDGGTLDYRSGGGPPMLYKADGTGAAVEITAQDGYMAELEYFVECCAGHREPVLCPPAESAAAVRLMRAAQESRTRDGEVIHCNW